MSNYPEGYAKKKFGQHFLHDPSVLERIVRSVNPKTSDAFIEIGPGRGALTVALLPHISELHAIEIDTDVIPVLKNKLKEQGLDESRLIIHQQDALKVDYAHVRAERPLRLIGNLPYNISTPLLFHLLKSSDEIQDMHFMLQKEVVDRIVAAPGTSDYGRLTVAIAARAKSEYLFLVKPGAFNPPPKVDSAIVRISPLQNPLKVENLKHFDQVVTAAFSQRRKTLCNCLKAFADKERIQQFLSGIGFNENARAETLSPAHFALLSNSLNVA